MDEEKQLYMLVLKAKVKMVMVCTIENSCFINKFYYSSLNHAIKGLTNSECDKVVVSLERVATKLDCSLTLLRTKVLFRQFIKTS